MIANLVLVIICLLLLIFIGDKQKGLRIAMILATLFWCLRFDWGNDYMGYLLNFADVNNQSVALFDFDSMKSMGRHSEFGWVFLNLVFGRILHVGFFGMIIALSVFENWVIYRFIKNNVEEKYYWLAILTYTFSTGLFAVNASMMRQYLCICGFLLCVEWMKERKWILSAIVIFLGATIHASNIFMLLSLPLFFINFGEGYKKWAVLIIGVILSVIWNELAPSLLENNIYSILDYDDELSSYSEYLKSSNSVSEGGGLGVVFRYIVLGTLLFILTSLSKKEQTVAILYIASYLFDPLSSVIPMISRFSMYFRIMSIAIWPLILKYTKNQVYSYMLLAAYFAVEIKSFFAFFNDPVWVEKFYEYHTIFSAGSWM